MNSRATRFDLEDVLQNFLVLQDDRWVWVDWLLWEGITNGLPPASAKESSVLVLPLPKGASTFLQNKIQGSENEENMDKNEMLEDCEHLRHGSRT